MKSLIESRLPVTRRDSDACDSDACDSECVRESGTCNFKLILRLVPAHVQVLTYCLSA